jgi:hypothetical protein
LGGQHTAQFLAAVGRCACASTRHSSSSPSPSAIRPCRFRDRVVLTTTKDHWSPRASVGRMEVATCAVVSIRRGPSRPQTCWGSICGSPRTGELRQRHGVFGIPKFAATSTTCREASVVIAKPTTIRLGTERRPGTGGWSAKGVQLPFGKTMPLWSSSLQKCACVGRTLFPWHPRPCSRVPQHPETHPSPQCQAQRAFRIRYTAGPRPSIALLGV